MIELLIPLISIAFGACLGIFYFGGLWLTLKHLPSSKQPELLVFGSFIGRSAALAVCLLGFYLVSGSNLGGLIFSLAGFILAKILLINRFGYGGTN